jgi:hypothetical protein
MLMARLHYTLLHQLGMRKLFCNSLRKGKLMSTVLIARGGVLYIIAFHFTLKDVSFESQSFDQS